MAKLTGAKKAAFLKRMADGRAAKSGKKSDPKRRKTNRSRTKTATVKRKSKSKRINNMAKKRFSRARRTGSKVFGSPLLRKAMIGIGAASLAGTVVNMVAPQFSPLARPIAGFMAGGAVGGIASLILSPNGLGSITGLFGMNGNTSSGGLTV